MNNTLAKSIRALLGISVLTLAAPWAGAIEVTPLGELTGAGLSHTGSVPKFAWDGNNNFGEAQDLGWAHNSLWFSFHLPAAANVRIAMTSSSAGMNPAFTLWSYSGEPDWRGVSFHGYNQVSAPTLDNSNAVMLPAVTGLVGYANSGPAGWTNGDGDEIGAGSAPDGSGFVAEPNSGSAELRLKDLPAGSYLAVIGGSCHTKDCLPVNNDFALTVGFFTPPPTNTIPVADAGAEGTIRAEAWYTLDGGDSFDADGDALRYQWKQTEGPAVTLSDATAPKPSFGVPLAAIGETLTFELTVSDGKAESDPATVNIAVVENSAPEVRIESAPTVLNEGSPIVLHATAQDSDGDALQFTWRQLGGPTVTLAGANTAEVSLTAPDVPAGGADLEFSVEASDRFGSQPAIATASVTIHVRDALDYLDCSHAQPSRLLLWPPDKRMVPVEIEGVTGPGDFALRIVSVTQDEAVVDRKAGDSTRHDAKIFTPKASKRESQPREAVRLRAERQLRKKLGNGRVYAIQFAANDGATSCEGSVRVAVPPKKRDSAVDDGQQFDSTAHH